jgi:hypothetical protein
VSSKKGVKLGICFVSEIGVPPEYTTAKDQASKRTKKIEELN